MKLKLEGNMLIVQSAVKTNDFLNAKKVESAIGEVEDTDGVVRFVMGYDPSYALPTFKEFEAKFNQTSNDGFMQAVIPLVPSEDYRKVIVEEFGTSLNAVRNADAIVLIQVKAVNDDMNELFESIE